MRILDRYILNSMLRVFVGCILIFLMLYVIIDLFSHLDEILKQRVNLNLLFAYYLNFLPFIFVQIAPLACLLGCLYTLGILNRNNEVVAMRTAGLSIFQIAKTIIIFACLISILVFLVNDKFVPQSEMSKQEIKSQMKRSSEESKEKSQAIITNLSIYGHECVTYFFDEENRLKGEPAYFSVQLMDITESPQDFLKQRQSPEFMSLTQLSDYILKLSMSRAETVVRNLRVDFYQRLFMPLTSLVIIFVGIPFALIIRRRATGLSSLGIAIMVGFLYYVVNAVSIAFGKTGLISPILAASLSHIIFLAFGLYLIQEFS